MENTINSPAADLYLMLGPHFETLRIKQCNDGDQGFGAFAQRNALRALQHLAIPDNWLFHYHFTDGQLRKLRGLAAIHDSNYFHKLRPQLLNGEMTPRHILPLERACQLQQKEKPMLTPERQAPMTTLRDLLPSGTNNDPEILRVRPLFRAYTGVETPEGVLLFSPTRKGMLLLEKFMQEQADNFYAPDYPLTEMNLFRIPDFDNSLHRHADQYGTQEQALLPSDILRGGVECLHFDMQPTGENFSRLVLPFTASGLRCSQRNFNIMSLQSILQTGKITPRQQEQPFGYMKEFVTHLQATDQAEEARQRCGKLAQHILDRDFPHRREPCNTPTQELWPTPDPAAAHQRHGRRP